MHTTQFTSADAREAQLSLQLALVASLAKNAPRLHAISNAPSATCAERELQPASVITDLLNDISHPELRRFMDTVLRDSQIQGLVTLPLVRHGMPVQFPIQHIRRLGVTLSATQARTRQEKDILLVATILWGIRSLLPLSIYGNSDVQDVFCTLIRPALHALDDATCEVSAGLRSLIGLGDEAAMQSDAIGHLQSRIQRAVSDMHQGKHWLLKCMREAIDRQTTRGIANFAQRAIPA